MDYDKEYKSRTHELRKKEKKFLSVLKNVGLYQ